MTIWVALPATPVRYLAEGLRRAHKRGELKQFAKTNPNRVGPAVHQRRCCFGTHREGTPMWHFDRLYNEMVPERGKVFATEAHLDAALTELMDEAQVPQALRYGILYGMKAEHLLIQAD